MTDQALTSGYRRWRASELGAITERIEQGLVLELAKPLDGRRVLDVGCGDGTYAVAAAERGAEVTGVDASGSMLGAARTQAVERGVPLELCRADATSLPFAEGSFDVVIAVTVLCFIATPERALREIARVLAPSGRLVLGALGRHSSWAAWRWLRGRLGHPVWKQARFHTARQLVWLTRGAGLAVERMEGAIYYPPLGVAARCLGPYDGVPRSLTTFGGAFIALLARQRGEDAGGMQ